MRYSSLPYVTSIASLIPSTIPPASAPVAEPKPPIATATNPFSPNSKPRLTFAETIGPIAAPPIPEIAPPRKNASERPNAVGTPRSAAASESSAIADSAIPQRVRSMNAW